MGPLAALIYVAIATAAILAASGLVGLLRGHVPRIHFAQSPWEIARQRYAAGEIGDRELEQCRRRYLAA